MVPKLLSGKVRFKSKKQIAGTDWLYCLHNEDQSNVTTFRNFTYLYDFEIDKRRVEAPVMAIDMFVNNFAV